MEQQAERAPQFFLEVPFYSELHFNTQLLLNEHYSLLSPLLAGLDADDTLHWSAPKGDRPESSDLVFDIDDRQGSTVVPLWLIAYRTEDTKDVCTLRSKEVELTPRSAEFRLYDFGVGSVIVEGQITKGLSGTRAELVQRVEEVSTSLAMQLHAFVAQRLNDVRRVLYAQPEATRYLIDGFAGRPVKDPPAPALRFLWVHRLLVFDGAADDLSAFEAVPSLECHLALHFATNSGQVFTFIPGQGSSVILGQEITSPPLTVTRPLSLLNAYWAASAGYDEAVFRGISRLHVISTKTSVEISGDAEEILELEEQALMFRAVLDHQAHHLGPQEQRVWQAISDAWNLQPLVEGIRSNVSTLESLFRNVADRVRSRQAESLNTIVALFTLLTAFVVATEWFAIFTDKEDVSIGLRVVLVIAVPLIAILAIWKLRERISRFLGRR